MFIIELTYKVKLPVVDKFLPEHRLWLDSMYEDDYFLCSGVKSPRNGGIILALVSSVEKLQQLLQNDPFYKNQIADYRIIEFKPSKYHNEFDRFIKLIDKILVT